MKLSDIDHLFISYEVVEMPQDGAIKNPDFCVKLGRKIAPGEYRRPSINRRGNKIPWEKQKYVTPPPWLKREPVHVRQANYHICIYVQPDAHSS